MSRPVPPAVPSARPVADALRDSAPLARLQERLRDAAARLDAIRGELPPALATQVAAGPVDSAGFSLLAANAAAAAKLRQLKPRLEARLCAAGFEPGAIRIKLHAGD